jgi:hypothetical protein
MTIAPWQLVDSIFPVCYRLIRRSDGKGLQEYVLQGHFLFTTNGNGIGREWRDLQTLDDPTSAEDHIPFGLQERADG